MTIKDYAVKVICEEGDKLNNKQIADKVKRQMNSRTTHKSIAWYKNKINRGLIKIDKQACKWLLKGEAPIPDLSLNRQEEENYTNEAEYFVYEYEKTRTGNYPKRAHSSKGYDFLSGDRHIEVKGSKKKRKTSIVLTANETEKLISDPLYWLYLVEGDFEKDSQNIDLFTIPKHDLLAMAQLKIQARLTQVSNQSKRKNEWQS